MDACSSLLLQLTGYNLVPFNYDKQVLLLDTIFGIFQCGPLLAAATMIVMACGRVSWRAAMQI